MSSVSGHRTSGCSISWSRQAVTNAPRSWKCSGDVATDRVDHTYAVAAIGACWTRGIRLAPDGRSWGAPTLRSVVVEAVLALWVAQRGFGYDRGDVDAACVDTAPEGSPACSTSPWPPRSIACELAGPAPTGAMASTRTADPRRVRRRPCWGRNPAWTVCGLGRAFLPRPVSGRWPPWGFTRGPSRAAGSGSADRSRCARRRGPAGARSRGYARGDSRPR